VLLHPTALPGPHGIGDLGPEAYRFADFLAAAGQSWWQMLPVHPPGGGNSPYQAHSVFAGSPLLVSLEVLAREGLLRPEELRPTAGLGGERVAYPVAWRYRMSRLATAHGRFRKSGSRASKAAFRRFRDRNRGWLDDYALFAALVCSRPGVSWCQWPAALRDRKPPQLAEARKQLAGEIEFHAFVQYCFERQWTTLRRYCVERGIGLIGDVPIYPDYNSAEVWAHRGLFHLDRAGRPIVVAGVPPDAFSAVGQLWNNPVYRWALMRQRGYRWWIERLRAGLGRFDVLRLDHFIGFQRYWEVRPNASDARGGRFRPGPRADFFRAVRKGLGGLPFIAEDLGLVTPEVEALRDQFGLPGMRVLQFAFESGAGDNIHLPHRYPRNCVAYTGTHDHDTTVGWFLKGRRRSPGRGKAGLDRERTFALRYADSDGGEIHWTMIRLAMASAADTVIVPLQDVLGLGSEARFNRPGTPHRNWQWRLAPEAVTPRIVERLREMTATYGRT
jgi:4-alpha-glucanotransferase